jgi:hypothetical protein
LSIRLSAMCPIYKVPSGLTTDPFCNAEARAAQVSTATLL